MRLLFEGHLEEGESAASADTLEIIPSGDGVGLLTESRNDDGSAFASSFIVLDYAEAKAFLREFKRATDMARPMPIRVHHVAGGSPMAEGPSDTVTR